MGVGPDGDGLVGPEDEGGAGSLLDIEGFDGSLTGGRRVWGDSYNHLHHVWHHNIATCVIVEDGTDDAGAVVVRRTCEYFVQTTSKSVPKKWWT